METLREWCARKGKELMRQKTVDTTIQAVTKKDEHRKLLNMYLCKFDDKE